MSHNDEPSRSFSLEEKETSFCLCSPWERSYIESHKIPKREREDFSLFLLLSILLQFNNRNGYVTPWLVQSSPISPLAPTFSFHFLFFLPVLLCGYNSSSPNTKGVVAREPVLVVHWTKRKKMNVCIYQQREREKKYISWGGPLFSLSGHIFRTLPFSIFGGDWKKKWGNTESKKKKPPCLSLHPPQQSLPSDVCLRKSPSRFLPSFGVLFFLSFLLPILFPFFSSPSSCASTQ